MEHPRVTIPTPAQEKSQDELVAAVRIVANMLRRIHGICQRNGIDLAEVSKAVLPDVFPETDMAALIRLTFRTEMAHLRSSLRSGAKNIQQLIEFSERLEELVDLQIEVDELEVEVASDDVPDMDDDQIPPADDDDIPLPEDE